MQDWPKVVGRNVRRLRLAKGATQEQLAHDADIDVTYLRGIELGRRNPSLTVMGRVADALAEEIEELLIRLD